MTTRRATGASVRSGHTVLAGIVGIGLLLTAAACTSSSTDAASSSASSVSSEGTSTTESGPAEASQVSDPSSSYSGAAPTVPSDGAPASVAGPSADAVTTTAPPVSTSGAAPTSGDINQVVPNRELVTNSAVPLDAASDLGGQISAKLTEVKAIDAQAKVPGEISGPAPLAWTASASMCRERAVFRHRRSPQIPRRRCPGCSHRARRRQVSMSSPCPPTFGTALR